MSLSLETRRLLRNTSTATLTTQLMKRGFRNAFMRGVTARQPGAHMVGEAYTLRYIPGREDITTVESLSDPEHPQRKAIESIPLGHVMVVDCRGETYVAGIGAILVARLKVRGAAGFVCDGGIRDHTDAVASQLPLFAASAAAPPNVTVHHAVDINTPIGCGGVPVFPGDTIVGDDDGVVVLPSHLTDEVAFAAAEQESIEEFVLEEIRRGAPLIGTYPPNAATLDRYRAQNGKA